MNKTNYLVMLIGAPGSGKSTYIKNDISIDIELINPVVISTDNYIQEYADKNNMTYNQAFSEYVKTAEMRMKLELANAIKDKRDIIWDQTNMSAKSRMNKLNKIPDFYSKAAVVFHCDRETLIERNKNREGKTIPTAIIDSMLASYDNPTFEEGFAVIIDRFN